MSKSITQIVSNLDFCDLKISEELKESSLVGADQLRSEINQGLVPIFQHLQGASESFLKEIREIAEPIFKFSQILVIGVGGSSLGAKTFCALSSDGLANCASANETSANSFVKNQPEVRFFESIDPVSIAKCMAWIDWQNCFFLIISKSGETIETTCHSLLILEILQQKFASTPEIKRRLLFVTESKSNKIAQIANNFGAKIVLHPSKIGGRFSCFSIVGILPALLAGIEVEAIFSGANQVLSEFLLQEPSKCKITKIVAAQIALFERGFVNQILMPYIDSFHNLAEWFRQLLAESLGKNGFGFTPINSQGTIDQHSQLQLYLDGPKDKFFNFITKKNYQTDFLINDINGVETVFGGKKLSQIIAIEEQTTIEMLINKGLPVRQFLLENGDCFEIAGLMMQMMLETLLIARIKEINPFNQPEVEARKNMAREILISKK